MEADTTSFDRHASPCASDAAAVVSLAAKCAVASSRVSGFLCLS